MKWLAIAACGVFLAGSAMVPSASASEAEARAKKLYAEARELHTAGLVREALDKLKQAYDMHPDDGILMSIVNRHMDLGEPEEAAAMLSLMKPKNPRMQGHANKLQTMIGEALAAPVVVEMRAKPDYAQFSVDGGPWQDQPATVKLKRGQHSFKFRAGGHEGKAIDRELKGSLVIQLEPELDAHFGKWQIRQEPEVAFDEVRVLFDEVQVMLSKKEKGAYVTRARSVRPGRYKVTCLKGIDTYVDAWVEVKSDQTAVGVCTFPEESIGLNTIMAWSTAALAVGALAAGTALLISWEQDKDLYEGTHDLKSNKSEAGWSLIGVGGALTATSILFFTDVIDLE